MAGKYSEKVMFVCRPSESNIYNCFPIIKYGDIKKKIETAKNWANIYYNQNLIKEAVIFDDIDNKFDHVVIESIELRGNGGRAWKVFINIDNKQFLVDLRENMLMNTISDFGIEKGGKLNGIYTFIQEVSQTNLVLINSKEHLEAIKDSIKRDTAIKIKKSELIIGNEYETFSGDKGVYLGKGENNTMLFADSYYVNELKTNSPYKSYARLWKTKSMSYIRDNGNKLSEDEIKEYLRLCNK